MIINKLDKIYSDSFGLWISGLFSAISGNNPEMSFVKQKEAFFFILKLWLDEGKIVFCNPSDPLNTVWKAESATIIEYLESLWPAEAKDEDDSELNVYFYEIPAILWVGKNGELHGA